jgi:uncharacterized protein (TIGR00725 family)
MRSPVISVIGPGQLPATDPLVEAAYAVGHGLASAGAVLVCGGLGGVMAAACRGAAAAGGLCIGLLPGGDARDANPWVSIALPTGLGEGRDLLVVRAASAVIAVGGSWGTLAELALARRADVPVVGLASWTVRDAAELLVPSGVIPATDAADAVSRAMTLARERTH